MHNRARPCLAALGLVLPTLVGCIAPPAPSLEPIRFTVRVSDYDAFIDQTLTLLREHDFEPTRVDRTRGLIVAGPTTGGQWFEFWRGDVQGPYQVVESSLHTIRRSATVSIEPLDAASQPASDAVPTHRASPDDEPATGATCRVSVEVDKSRYSAPERQVTATSGILGVYSERATMETGLRGARSLGEHWVPLGRDGLLEAHLLSRLAELPAVESVEPP